MYLNHYGFKDKPFRLAHDSAYYYPAAHQLPLNELLYSIEERQGQSIACVEEIAYMIDWDMFEHRKAQAADRDPVLAYTGDDCSKLSSDLLDSGVKIAGIKVGVKGCYLRTAGREALSCLAPIADVLDKWSNREVWAGSYKAEKFGSATGAGDVTIAGFLTAFLRGLDPVESVKSANILGWQNVREIDTLSGIEDWPVTVAMVNDKGKELNLLKIDDPGWKYKDSEKIYYGPNDSSLR